MAKSYQIIFEPLGRSVTGTEGTTILQAAWDAGVPLASVCGGEGSCGRCQVMILSGTTSPLTSTEQSLLTDAEIAAGLRLACQTTIRGDLRVNIPPHALVAQQRLQVAGLEPAVSLEPVVAAYTVTLPQPTLADLRSDLTRLTDSLHATGDFDRLDTDLCVGRELPALLRQTGWQATVAVRDHEIVAVRPPGETLLGVAVDLGTTKIAAYLVDLSTGATLASAGVMNPQIAYGEDVMSRIAYAQEAAGGAERLRQAVVHALNGLIAGLCQQAGRSPESVIEVTLVANTAMHHLFLGLPVAQLGTAPYVPAVSDALDIKARDLGLVIAPGGYVHLPPVIAGFVGADHVAMILATGLDRSDATVLALDIGTNTEVVLAHQGQLTCCSTASGPAFEGAHIHAGMRAASGAIEKVRINGDQVQIETIDNAASVGICGSGILDAVAGFARAGVIDRAGRLQADHPLVKNHHGQRVVPLAAGSRGEIIVTQRDIREIQLAKGAIRAGSEILLRHAGISYRDLEQIIIAGAFGTYIDPESAIRVGMLPPVTLDQVRQVGNAAGVGAKLALISRSQRTQAAAIARRTRYIELTTYPDFTDLFAQAMSIA